MLNSSCASTGPLLRTRCSGHPLGPARLAVVSPIFRCREGGLLWSGTAHGGLKSWGPLGTLKAGLQRLAVLGPALQVSWARARLSGLGSSCWQAPLKLHLWH